MASREHDITVKHVAHELGLELKLVRDVLREVTGIKATKELYHKVLGTIDTKEKFEAKRLELAENVGASMRATDTRECRNCHSLEHMDLEMQDKSARKKHNAERWAKRGETCIDCHQGIAHELPEES